MSYFDFGDPEELDPTPQPQNQDEPTGMSPGYAVGPEAINAQLDEFATVISDGLEGLLGDNPDVPAIAVIYLHLEEGGGIHPHVEALVTDPTYLAMLGFMGGPILVEYGAEYLHDDLLNEAQGE